MDTANRVQVNMELKDNALHGGPVSVPRPTSALTRKETSSFRRIIEYLGYERSRSGILVTAKTRYYVENPPEEISFANILDEHKEMEMPWSEYKEWSDAKDRLEAKWSGGWDELEGLDAQTKVGFDVDWHSRGSYVIAFRKKKAAVIAGFSDFLRRKGWKRCSSIK